MTAPPDSPECSFSKLVEKFILTDVRTAKETGLAILILFERFDRHVDSSLGLVAHAGGKMLIVLARDYVKINSKVICPGQDVRYALVRCRVKIHGGFE